MTPVSVEMNADSLAQSIATISEDGQIILTGDSGLNGKIIIFRDILSDSNFFMSPPLGGRDI
jgi:hypothetical protein